MQFTAYKLHLSEAIEGDGHQPPLLASFDTWEMSLRVFHGHRHRAPPLFSGGRDGTVCTGSSPPTSASPYLAHVSSAGSAPAFPLSCGRGASLRLLTRAAAPIPRACPYPTRDTKFALKSAHPHPQPCLSSRLLLLLFSHAMPSTHAASETSPPRVPNPLDV